MIKNPSFRNLEKIEFVVTYACTGRCKHCSEGDHSASGEWIDPRAAADAVSRISGEFDIKTVMAFGGEPLLYPEAVYAIMDAAREMKIPRRQVITNGYFSPSGDKRREVAEKLASVGVNDLLLSVDAFHQQTIPIGAVRSFAEELTRVGIPVRLSPAWLVSKYDDNIYNAATRDVIKSLADLGIPESEGNIIFPEGNAKIYLSDYFCDKTVPNPYLDDPRDIRCISFEPNGDVLGENIYRRDILEIIRSYIP
jgi:hypothetical protein